MAEKPSYRIPVNADIVTDLTPQLGGDLSGKDTYRIYNLPGLEMTAFAELTLDTDGIIAVTQMLHTVDTFEGAASDDLVTVNGGATVNLIVLKAEHTDRTIVVKHGTGNIWLQGKADISLDDLEDGIMLVWTGTNWIDIAAGGAGGGAGSDTTAIHTTVDGEIVAVAEKTAATGADEIIIEDSAAANAKKSVKLQNLSGMSGCRVRAYVGTALSAKPLTWVRVPYSVEDFDAGGDFNVTGATGTADATEANKLHDADAGFTSALVGACVHNTTDDTYAVVSAYVDSGELTISADIMADTETYVIYPAFFTVPENGYYSIKYAVALGGGADATTDLHVSLMRYRASSELTMGYAFVTGANAGGFLGWPCSDLLYLQTGDLLWLNIYHTSSGNVNIADTSKYTYIAISLESRP